MVEKRKLMITKQMKKNYILQVSYQILNMLLPFITSPYISRVLGAENLGIYSYTFSIANMFILFINLGIEKYGSRMIAMVKDNQNEMDKDFSELLFLKIFLGVFVISVYLVCVMLLFEYKLYFIIQIFLLISAVLDVNWFFFGIEKFQITVTRNFIFKIVTVVCVFLFVHSSNDLWKYIMIMALGTCISQSAVWIVLKNFVNIKFVRLHDIFRHLKSVSVLFLAILAQSVYTYVDKIMIKQLSTMEQLGYCENAYKVISFPMGLITSLGVVMLPRMSALYHANDEQKANDYIYSSMKYVMILAFGMTAGISSVGENFSIIFWGNNFLMSGKIIKIISPIVLFMSWSDVIRSQYLIPKGYDREYSLAIIIGAIVNVLFNALLIPKYGAFGAAAGTILSYFSIAFYQTFVTRKYFTYPSFFRSIFPYILFSLFMFLTVKKLGALIGNTTILTFVFQILTGITIYGICIASWLCYKKDILIINIIKKYINK